MRFTAISLAAVLGGLAVLISLFVIYVWIWTRGAFSAQLSNGNGFLSVAMVTLNYLIGGGMAGVLARGNEVLNAALAGLAFGLLLWAVYLLFFGGDLSSAGSLSPRSVGIGALAFVVAVCAAGGSLVSLVRRQRKATE